MNVGITSSSMMIAATMYSHNRSPWVIWVSEAGRFIHCMSMPAEQGRVEF